MSEEKPTGPLLVDYAVRHRSPRLPGRLLATGIVSLLLATLTGTASLVLAYSSVLSAASEHKQLVALPTLIASMNASNASATSRDNIRLAKMRAAAAARQKLGKVRPLTENEAAHVVELVQSQLRERLSPQRAQSLIRELEKQDEFLVDPAIPISTTRLAIRGPSPFQVVLADTGGRGEGESIRVMTLRSYISPDDNEGTTIELGLDGQVHTNSLNSVARRVALVQSRPIASTLPAEYATLLANWQREYVKTAITSGIAATLAAELMIAAILALRGSRRWTFYHRLFAWLQLLFLLAVELIGNSMGLDGNRGATLAFLMSVPGAIYALILIFTMPREVT